MSYQQFQQRCEDCGKTWNAAFGIVGITQIAAAPTACPFCKSERLVKHADGWTGAPLGQATVAASKAIPLPSELLGLIEAFGYARARVVRRLGVSSDEYHRADDDLVATRTALIAGIQRYREEGQEAAGRKGLIYSFVVDGKEYQSSEPILTSSQVMVMANIGPHLALDLFLDVPGDAPDTIAFSLRNPKTWGTLIHLARGPVYFYTMPSAIVGNPALRPTPPEEPKP